MQKYFYILIILSAFSGLSFARPPTRAGGVPCAACTIGVMLVEQQAQYHNESVSSALGRMCGYLPDGEYQVACYDVVGFLGPILIDLLYMKLTPDIICQHFTFCKDEKTGPQCRLFPNSKGNPKSNHLAQIIVRKHLGKLNLIKFPAFCDIPGIKFFCDLFTRVFDKRDPALDLDKDGFSTLQTLRGTDWRGKDCSDLFSRFHPGASPYANDVEYDSNCNGIFGIDPEDFQPYEKKFCENSGQLGSIILGDSASAHFHIPPEWVRAPKLDADVLAHLPYVVENEIDWPMMSAMTGFKNLTWPISQGPVKSMYQMLRERNRCNHRDYQNLCVNGADIFDLQTYMKKLSRDQTVDHPALVAIALVGNDVCNGYADTEAHMTTPQQMHDNMINTLKYLDTRLPNGSHILLIGLADGRYLYELLHDRYHPFGELNHDIKYPEFYTYLSCLQTSPCNGWMTTNETLRNYTSERAVILSKTLSQLAAKYQNYFKHFDVHYIDCPLTKILLDWEKKHGPGSAYQLIEPVDGFHPNQYAEALFATTIYEYLEKNLPHYLGPINPYNKDIKEIFGDQGGY